MNLNFTSKCRPSAVERRKRNPRDIVTGAINLQISAISNAKQGKDFTIPRQRYVNISEGGHDRHIKTTVQAKPKPWWWDEDGVYYLQPRFGTHLIEIIAGKPTIECGNSLDDVRHALEELHRMVEAGEVDEQIHAARERAKKR